MQEFVQIGEKDKWNILSKCVRYYFSGEDFRRSLLEDYQKKMFVCALNHETIIFVLLQNLIP